MTIFSLQVYTYADPKNFNPEEYFKDYHYFEVYDENKYYPQENFLAKYKNDEEHTYQYCLYRLSNGKQYVVAKEILSDEEKKELIKYCRCAVHSAPWYNILKRIMCSCCVGCIQTFNPSQAVINASRDYKKKCESKTLDSFNISKLLEYLF